MYKHKNDADHDLFHIYLLMAEVEFGKQKLHVSALKSTSKLAPLKSVRKG